ncbi:unnamed protein product [Closterium sp. NIES-54]
MGQTHKMHLWPCQHAHITYPRSSVLACSTATVTPLPISPARHSFPSNLPHPTSPTNSPPPEVQAAQYLEGGTAAAERQFTVTTTFLCLALGSPLAAALYVEGGAAAAERQFTIATLLDSRFSNLAWLESERHWPPTLLLHMKRFLLLQ